MIYLTRQISLLLTAIFMTGVVRTKYWSLPNTPAETFKTLPSIQISSGKIKEIKILNKYRQIVARPAATIMKTRQWQQLNVDILPNIKQTMSEIVGRSVNRWFLCYLLGRLLMVIASCGLPSFLSSCNQGNAFRLREILKLDISNICEKIKADPNVSFRSRLRYIWHDAAS